MTHIAPLRSVRTRRSDGRETYADTGRAVDEKLGSHVALWIVEDAEAWASAIEADGDAELGRWPKGQRGTGELRKAQLYDSAAKVRRAGARRDVHSHHHGVGQAGVAVAGLRRAHPNPGVRYEVAAITQAGACPDCRQPTVRVEGRWHHHLLRYPSGCG